MKNPRVFQRLARAMAAGACALLVLGAVPAFAAAPPEPERIAFGLVGITFGQAVQVSVANTRLAQPPEPDAPPIAVEIVFLDGDGSVFKRSVQTVATGHSATLTLARGELSPRGGRAMVRALVRFSAASGAGRDRPRHPGGRNAGSGRRRNGPHELRAAGTART